MTLSPDGKWLWDGNGWIPAPPQSNVLPQSSINQEQIFSVANQTGVNPNQLTQIAPYFDHNQDGVLQPSELQQAAMAVSQSPTIPVPVQAHQQPGMQQPIMQQNTMAMGQMPQQFAAISTSSGRKGKMIAAFVLAIIILGGIIYAWSTDLVSENQVSHAKLDKDSDGIFDELDNCVFTYNPDQLDYDGDGDGDVCDKDSDNDGVYDSLDLFPLDPTEWYDGDGDGIGDNTDTDYDNDGVANNIDVIDWADTSLLFQFSSVKPIEKMDYFDNYAELYFCMSINGVNQGCIGDTWSIITGTEYYINQDVLIDLSEEESAHEIIISLWDQDISNDDLMDINPAEEHDSFAYTYYSSSFSTSDDAIQFNASGEGDGAGWDGVLLFSISPINLITYGNKSYEWIYSDTTYYLDWGFDYSTYLQFKQLDHTVSSNSDYARFSTPDEIYVINLANELNELALNEGYSSDIERAEFILSFVGAIPYQYDIDGTGYSEYPKYPIEMLWENAGDCEDASALYISVMESLEFDAALALLEIKSSNDEDDDWGGHAFPIIHIPDYSGEGYQWTEGDKADIPFYIAEATGWYDGQSAIGQKWWDEEQNLHMYDIE